MRRIYSGIVMICSAAVLFFFGAMILEKEKTTQDAIGSEIQQPDFYLDCGDTSILPWEKEGTLYWFLPPIWIGIR